MVIKWKHGIGPNDMVTFNEELEFLSASIIELVNIDESSHENVIVIFTTTKNLNKTENNYVTEDDDGNMFEFSYYKKVIYNDFITFMVSWWLTNSYVNNEQIQVIDIKKFTSG